ncbi:GTPase [Streptomyces sp. NPDC005438]|uniref:GTPase n=1 Tax=Streptomyces sp. NPDC005438 TaxID=3156880 RepID=UPI0033A19A2F
MSSARTDAESSVVEAGTARFWGSAPSEAEEERGTDERPAELAAPRSPDRPRSEGAEELAEDSSGAERFWDDGLIARRAATSAEADGRTVEGRPSRVVRSRAVDADTAEPVPSGAPDEERPAGPRQDGPEPEAAVREESETASTDAVDVMEEAAPPSATATIEAPLRPSEEPSEPLEGVPGEEGLAQRLRALRELVIRSRGRVDEESLVDAVRLLSETGDRRTISRTFTTVALAGATGSGKSALFNALAGGEISESGVARPTTREPLACTWVGPHAEGAERVLDRLAVGARSRRWMRDPELNGLVLIDLPDHDSTVEVHRQQVDRLLSLVDAVVWVVDPEKYADAALHERYLRPLAGYSEVTVVVLNQSDRLPGDAREMVLDDLRRLLDEDGVALGEHGEPGAQVLATSAVTGAGVPELRENLVELVRDRHAASRRLAADLDQVVEGLRPYYVTEAEAPAGLTEEAYEEFDDRLAASVGAVAEGEAAERLWRRQARHACATPWSRMVRRRRAKAVARTRTEEERETRTPSGEASADPLWTARPVLAEAVRSLTQQASDGLPPNWARSVRDAAWRGADGLPEALDTTVAPARRTSAGAAEEEPVTPRPRWWTVVRCTQSLLVGLLGLGAVWGVAVVLGLLPGPLWAAAAVCGGALVAGPLLAWGTGLAARGPARAYGLEREKQLRRLAAGCGRLRVLEPVAAEWARYEEVRERYLVATGVDAS